MTKLFEDWSVISSSSEYEDDLASTVSTNNLEDEDDQLVANEPSVLDADAAANSDSELERPSTVMTSSAATLKLPLPVISLGESTPASLDSLLEESTASGSESPSGPEDNVKQTQLACEPDSDSDSVSCCEYACDTRKLCPYVACSRLAPHIKGAGTKWIAPIHKRVTQKSTCLHNNMVTKLTLVKTGLSHDYVIVNAQNGDSIDADVTPEGEETVEVLDNDDPSKCRFTKLWDKMVLSLVVDPSLEVLNAIKPGHLIYIVVSWLLATIALNCVIQCRVASITQSYNAPLAQPTSSIVPQPSLVSTAMPTTESVALPQVTSLESCIDNIRERWARAKLPDRKVLNAKDQYLNFLSKVLYKERAKDISKGWRPTPKEFSIRLYEVLSKETDKWTRKSLIESRKAWKNGMHHSVIYSNRAKNLTAQFVVWSRVRGAAGWEQSKAVSSDWIDGSIKVAHQCTERTRALSVQGWRWSKTRGIQGWDWSKAKGVHDWTVSKKAVIRWYYTGKQSSQPWIQQRKSNLKNVVVLCNKVGDNWRTKGWPYSKQKIASLEPMARELFIFGRKGLTDASVTANTMWADTVAPSLKQLLKASEQGCFAAVKGLKRTWVVSTEFASDILEHATKVADEILGNPK